MQPPVQPNSLWDFSLALYAQPGVADACLHLQDEQSINVNLVLWCVWLECQGLQLNDRQLEQAQGEILEWDQQYVVPLRRLRRQMKTEFGADNTAINAVRGHIKQAELAAEQVLQLQLQQLAHPSLPAEGVRAWVYQRGEEFAGTNLRRYLDAGGVDSGASDTLRQCLTAGLRNILSN
jgi:uncharacterized protein (TIGR02444 family)